VLERRKDFHRQVGEALESLFPERKDELAGLLAHHFDLGGEPAKALEYLLAAGDRMRYQDALDESISYYRHAAELLAESGDLRRLIDVWLKLGLVYHLDSQYPRLTPLMSRLALQRRLPASLPPEAIAASRACPHTTWHAAAQGHKTRRQLERVICRTGPYRHEQRGSTHRLPGGLD
jgi:hypothetical protein